jgi:hypothetical protein
VRGISKYGPLQKSNLERRAGLTEREQELMEDLSSHGLTKKTWANYKTAERLFAKCCREKGIRLELPAQETTIIIFILWLAEERKVCAATIQNYLAGIRQLHIDKGAPVPIIKSELVNLMIKGKKNKEAAAKRERGALERQPVTPDILRLFKARLQESEFCGTDQRLLWAVCTILFFGAFRGHELLCRFATEFDPAYTLCFEDHMLASGPKGESVLQLRIKAPKEDKEGKSIIVDVFEAGQDICPVRAFCKWREQQPPGQAGQPLFRWKSGLPLTGQQFNKILKERLHGYLDEVDKLITAHSFRTGAASMMGTIGYSDKDIMALGRWSSRAFESYLKLPRAKRLSVAKKFSKQFDK